MGKGGLISGTWEQQCRMCGIWGFGNRVLERQRSSEPALGETTPACFSCLGCYMDGRPLTVLAQGQRGPVVSHMGTRPQWVMPVLCPLWRLWSWGEELVFLHYEMRFVTRKILHALKRCGYNIWVCKALPDGNSNELHGIWHKWALFWVLKTCNAVLSWLSQKPLHNMSLNVMNTGRAEHDLKCQGS